MALVFPHLRQLYRVAFRFTGSAHEAEDLVQDVLAGLLPRVAELDSIERLGPWLARVLYRRYVDQYRRRQSSPVDESVSIDADEQVGLCERKMTSDGIGEHARMDMQRTLDRALARLPDSGRDIVLLHDVEGYTVLEIAGILALEVGTVKSRLHRSRKKLQQWLGDESAPAGGEFSDRAARVN
ncbi:sigma-70 family RNA polymerase sigma factor [uncultured Microbulbifer sp.]|uniref:RNA polymerase sigma factor n=1 Tax=uncultured Microbulbifer sp. TaxID=348147 RepID=UPI002618715F|nr:sigma-70 family RNA polymerase sigma factor [uncultured Microbulbifer sp.]